METNHDGGVGSDGSDARDLALGEGHIETVVGVEHLLKPDIDLKKAGAARREFSDIALRHLFPRPAGTGTIREAVDKGSDGFVVEQQGGAISA